MSDLATNLSAFAQRVAAEIVTVRSEISSSNYPEVQAATLSSNKFIAPDDGTWFCFGGYRYSYSTSSGESESSGTATRFVTSGTYAGGATIASVSSSYSVEDNAIVCIRVA